MAVGQEVGAAAGPLPQRDCAESVAVQTGKLRRRIEDRPAVGLALPCREPLKVPRGRRWGAALLAVRRALPSNHDASRRFHPRQGTRASPCAASATYANERHAWIGQYPRPGTSDRHRARRPSLPPSSTRRRSGGCRDRTGYTERRARGSERIETFVRRDQPRAPPPSTCCR